MLDPKYRVIVEEALREAGFDPSVKAARPTPKAFAEYTPIVIARVAEKRDTSSRYKHADLLETARLYKKHGSCAAVGKILGMSASGVLSRLKKAGVEVDGPGRKKSSGRTRIVRSGAYERAVPQSIGI